MKKEIRIEGMTCNHCKAHVEKALSSIEGVTAKVNLAKKNAVVSFSNDVSDETLRDAVTEAGYEVVSINVKKGLFS